VGFFEGSEEILVSARIDYDVVVKCVVDIDGELPYRVVDIHAFLTGEFFFVTCRNFKSEV